MSQKVQISKRQQAAAAKRAAIIASPAFQTWWSARQNISPVPSDPYRAFMIDIGLYARPMRKEIWQFRTNRTDYPPVDLPKGLPRRKRRLPSKKQIKRLKKRPKPAQPLTVTPFEKELIAETEKFVEKYHLPRVKVRFEPRGTGAAYVPALFGTPMILMPKGYVATGAKIEGVRQQVVATITHEKGHHAHVIFGTPQKALGTGLAALITAPPKLYGKGRLESERIAWKIAKKHLALKWTPVMGWRKRYAFGTYLRITPSPRIVRPTTLRFVEPKKRKRH